MISVIICSRTSTIGTALSENIKNSIGCEYELISIDNSKNTYSIFEAYNLGIQKSKFDFLCFIIYAFVCVLSFFRFLKYTGIFKKNGAIFFFLKIFNYF